MTPNECRINRYSLNIESYWFEININIQFIFSLFISDTAISSNMQKLTRKKKMYDIIQVPNSVNLTAAHLYSIKALKFLFHKKINEWCRKVITTYIFVTKYLWKYWAWILNFIDIHLRWNLEVLSSHWYTSINYITTQISYIQNSH